MNNIYLYKRKKKMECPQCHGLSVVIKDGTKYCQAAGCTYMSYHVITYQNQIRQFQGEKGAENRFTMISGGQNKQKESKLQKNFHDGSKIIKTLASAMKLSVNIVEKAEAKLIQILKLKYPEYEKDKQQEDNQKTKGKDKEKINLSIHKIAAYCLYAACFDKKMYFKDVRIANQMYLSKQQWGNIVKDLNTKLKDIMVVPFLHLEHYVLRVAQKRKIRDIEKKAMIEMVKRVKDAEIVGGTRPNTIAACIFWQIMSRSSKYNANGEFDIRQYLKSTKEVDENENYWTQKHFQASYDAIKKFKNEFIQPKINKLIPDFQGRLEELPIKNI